MNKIKSFLLAGALLAGSATAALASPIIGTIDISGTAIGTGTGSNAGIKYTTDPASSSAGTGILTGFGGAGNVTFVSQFIYSTLKTDPSQILYSITSGQDTLVFYVTGFDVVNGISYAVGNVYIDGTLVGTGSTGETFTGSAPGNLGLDFDGQLTIDSIPGLTPTPEPSSFILLGTGLISACGAAIRRRRMAATA